MALLNDTPNNTQTTPTQPQPPGQNWLDQEKDTIMIYGPPKAGKTWAYCSIIEHTINKGGNIHIINTDGGVSRTFKQYFEQNHSKIKNKTKLYFADNIKKLFDIIPQIKKEVKPNDTIIIDLLSDIWELSQHRFMEEASGGNIIDFIYNASKDRAKFGLFEAMKWNYIKKLDNYIIEQLIISPPCMIIGICAEKDLEVEKEISKTKYIKTDFDVTGARPAGQKQLSYKFNTIIYLNKTEKGHYFQIVGDRGSVTNTNHISFEKNFYEKFLEVRK